jgi:RNA polymerase sigma-70 factor (ECF subfamily)
MVKENDCLDLITGARSGDRESMGLLAARIHDRLYPYLQRATSDHHLSQDLLQEVLLTMLRRVSRLEKPESFWPWLYKIARSRIHRHYQRERRRRLLHTQLIDDACHSLPRRSGVLESIVRQEKHEDMAVAVSRLDERYRDVVRLRCLEDMPYAEIAGRTETSPELARIRFLRAKRSLRNCPLVAAMTGD